MSGPYWAGEDDINEGQKRKYGTILEIPPKVVIEFACGLLCGQRGGEPVPEETECSVMPRHLGSSSIVFTVDIGGVKMVIRVPADGWEGKWSEKGRTRLRCHAEMLLFLRHIGLPVPEVYFYERSLNNPLGHPYIAMSFLEGESLERQWNDPTGQKSPETPGQPPSLMHPRDLTTRRRETIRSLAIYMQTLSLESFESVAAVSPEDNTSSLGIGDVYFQIRERLQLANTTPLPQTTNASDFLQYEAVRQFQPNFYLESEELGADKMVQEMIQLIHLDMCRDFTLRKPRLELRDIRVNEEGTVIGILDWENTLAFPRCLGSLVPPPWICVDWNPTQDGYIAQYNRRSNNEQNFNYQRMHREAYYETFLGPDPASNKDTIWCETAQVRDIIWRAYTDPNIDNVRRAICRMMLLRFRTKDYRTPNLQNRVLREMISEESFSRTRWGNLRTAMLSFGRQGVASTWI